MVSVSVVEIRASENRSMLIFQNLEGLVSWPRDLYEVREDCGLGEREGDLETHMSEKQIRYSISLLVIWQTMWMVQDVKANRVRKRGKSNEWILGRATLDKFHLTQANVVFLQAGGWWGWAFLYQSGTLLWGIIWFHHETGSSRDACKTIHNIYLPFVERKLGIPPRIVAIRLWLCRSSATTGGDSPNSGGIAKEAAYHVSPY